MKKRNFVLAELFEAATPQVQAAILELESRGFMWCAHFGTQNAQDLLEGMNEAMEDGLLYEWLRRYMGVDTRSGPEGRSA